VYCIPEKANNQDFLDYWMEIKGRIEEGHLHWIPEFFQDIPAQQCESIRKILINGKRIRGCLVCLMSQALGGTLQAAIPRAVAIECIQTASLIHDDYVDQDTVRRGGAATWTVEGSRMAVLLGDLIFATVIRKMVEMSREDGSVIAEAIATMAKGAYQEQRDWVDLAPAIAAGNYRPEFYDRIIHLKTGALFGAASKLGAVAAGAPATVAARAFEFGARLGEAYQIADDLQEVMTLNEPLKDLSKTRAELAPLFLYFSSETKSHLLRLLEGQEDGDQDWIEHALPVLKTRMRQEIALRLDLAVKTLKDFPDNSHARMLYAAPSAVVQMMRVTTRSGSSS
jgi:Geranylgeranyl pyrophosphate synthase